MLNFDMWYLLQASVGMLNFVTKCMWYLLIVIEFSYLHNSSAELCLKFNDSVFGDSS